MTSGRHRIRRLPDGRWMCSKRSCRFVTDTLREATAHALGHQEKAA